MSLLLRGRERIALKLPNVGIAAARSGGCTDLDRDGSRSYSIRL
jgi:hypothetical protein